MTFLSLKIGAPAGMAADAFMLRPIVVADAELDDAAVMESRESLRLREQSTWPEDVFAVEHNREPKNQPPTSPTPDERGL